MAELMSVKLNMWHQVGMTHHSIFAAAWKIFSVRPDRDRFLSNTTLRFECTAYGLRGQQYSILLQFLADVCWSIRLCRGTSSGPSRECTPLFLSPNRVKPFLSQGPSLVNTVALTRLLRRVGLSLLCLSLENTLAVCEGRVPLDAVTGLSLLFLGFFFLSHDSDSENCVWRHPKLLSGVYLLPLPTVLWTTELVEGRPAKKNSTVSLTAGGGSRD
ncbi:hypothetical protein Tco_1277513 [Tanacetum coccineum]